jgi:Tol biopolymer transport system component
MMVLRVMLRRTSAVGLPVAGAVALLSATLFVGGSSRAASHGGRGRDEVLVTAPARRGGGRLATGLSLVERRAGQRDSVAALGLARASGVPVVGSRIRVIVDSTSTGGAGLAAVGRANGRVEARAGKLVQALVSPLELDVLARAPGVLEVRAPALHRPELVDGEEVGASWADVWHGAGSDGAGVKIAVVDLGFAGYQDAVASADLPAGVTTVDLCGGDFTSASDHGTAAAEIVHEMAPAAALTLICVDSEVTLAEATQYAIDHGIVIINHSVGWYGTARGDGTGGPGSPDASAAEARAHGVLWVNAAGNDAQDHWSGTFTDSNGNDVEDFAPGDEGNTVVIGSGEQACASLRWDAWPVTSQDYDLALVRSRDLSAVASSTDDQSSGPSQPTEELCYTNPGPIDLFALVIVRHSATETPRFDLFYLGDAPLEYSTRAGSVVDPAASPSVLAAGAVCWKDNSLEPYSAQGPTIDGRRKPDIAAPDSVSSATYGPFTDCGTSGFAGTSASAPAVAGAAALVKGWRPSATPSDLQAALDNGAVDLGPSGPDDTFGSGRLLVPAQNGRGRIVFQSDRTGTSQIYTMNADGTGQVALTSSGANTFPAWSPDGSKIAFSSDRDGDSEIYVMDAGGANQTRVAARPSSTDLEPAWSPDGSKLAFSSFTGSDYDIWTMNTNGTAQTDITNNPAEDSLPSWKPDGSAIAFSSNRDGNDQIYSIDPTGANLTKLSAVSGANEAEPAWSPDGSELAFVSTRACAPCALSSIWVSSSTSTRRLTDYDNGSPAWSRDGSLIAFMSHRDFNDEIYVMSANGGGPTRLTNNAPPGNTLPEDWFPSWGPPAAPTAPVNTRIPAVLGTAREGELLAADAGAWDSNVTPDFSLQWLRCIVTCTPISGATDTSYQVAAADVGSTLALSVTASNAVGSTVIETSGATPVRPAPPVDTTLPSIAGTGVQGQSLTVSPGIWTGGPSSYSYQWRRCTATGGTCTSIAGATTAGYVVTPADAGSGLRAAVWATSGAGTGASASSVRPIQPATPAPSTSPPAAPPATVDRTPPRISGLAVSPSTFRRARGATVHYRLSERATVLIRVERLRTRGRHALLPGALRHASMQGITRIKLLRLAGKLLPAGRYRLVANATDSAKNHSATSHALFRVTTSPARRAH